jgi:hypothetical protein
MREDGSMKNKMAYGETVWVEYLGKRYWIMRGIDDKYSVRFGDVLIGIFESENSARRAAWRYAI